MAFAHDRPGAGDGEHVAAIHDRIRRGILDGEFAAGDDLSQARLAMRLGVGRTPLREAMRMLIGEGLVESRRNRKLRVAGFSIADMEELYVTRVALEAVAVRVCVPRLTALEVGAMEGLFAQLVHFAEENDYASWDVPHRELHRMFVMHAGGRVVDSVTQLSEHAERYRRAYTTRNAAGYGPGLAEHRAIIDACKRRDGDGAARALVAHLGHVALGLIAMIEPGHDSEALRIAMVAAAGTPEVLP